MNRSTVVLVLAGIALLCAAPFIVREYHVEILTVFLINLLLAQSYRLVTTTGDWTLSHVVFMGVGGYATALLAKNAGLPFWFVVPLAALVTAAIALAVVVPLLRTRGFGFFIASFAIAEFIRHAWIKFKDPFGGARGMIGIPMIELGEIDFYESTNFYMLTLVITLVSLAVLYRLDRSRLGDAWKTIYMDRDLAECIGINVAMSRLQVFVIAAFFAGVAGSLLAYRLGAIDPHNFTIETMVYLVIWVVVGGTATFWGPVIGVVSMTFVFELARPLHEWRPLLFGVILIVFLTMLPGGLESLFPRIGNAIRNKLARGSGTNAVL